VGHNDYIALLTGHIIRTCQVLADGVVVGADIVCEDAEQARRIYDAMVCEKVN